MGFAEILGQDPAVRTLVRALESKHVHHAYRFEGPEGVGKEKAAFALAQALVCEALGPLACERCSACRRAVAVSDEEPHVPLHPDVVLVQRGLYPPALLGSHGEATGISVEQIRRIVLARAGYAPHEGRALVFIVRAAEELTVQAANALLKTLEEPHAGSYFVLITSQPNRLLDTVRSRTLAVRFGPLPDEIVADIAERHGAPRAAAMLAQGSAARALEIADPEGLREKEEFVQATEAAIAAPDLASGLGLSDSRASDRDGLRRQLGFLAQSLATESRVTLPERPDFAELLARRHEVVLSAMNELERNVQPALVLDSMLVRLRRV